MKQIFISGDTHGDIDIKKFTTKNFPHNNIDRSDIVIICGDFGGVWYGNKKDNYILKWWENKPWTTVFIDGNHENFETLYSYPIEEWCGGKIHKICPHVYHLMRGEIFNINGNTFFTMGGATSHDKWCRKDRVSWWEEEIPTVKEMEYGLNNLEKHGNNIDYIIAHSIPTSNLLEVSTHCEKDCITDYWDIIKTTVKYKKFFSGHYHKDKEISDNIRLIYNDIIKV